MTFLTIDTAGKIAVDTTSAWPTERYHDVYSVADRRKLAAVLRAHDGGPLAHVVEGR